MQIDSTQLSFLYENILINEISKIFIDDIKEAIKEKELPFQDIFNDKLRIIVPISGTEIYNEILNDVSKINGFSSFDPKKKEVVRTITLDPKYGGGGTKKQSINLGKAINSLKIDPETKKRYLNWFANYESNIPEMDNLSQYSVIISRSPIDVLRMSDISNISSCHSETGSYFYCAIQEAKKGGAVAYIVKTDDLKKLSDEEFQNEEIFEDKSRQIKGIGVLARIRIRKYKISTEEPKEIAVSETRTYGSKIPGFYDTVNSFLQKNQNFNADTIFSLYKNKKIIRTGGTYTDTSDSAMFNKMFDTDVFHGSTPHEATTDEEDYNDILGQRARQFEEELREFEQRINFEHCGVGFQVEEENEEVYYTAWGSITIDLGDYELVDDFIATNDSYEYSSIKNFNPNSTYRSSLPYQFRDLEDPQGTATQYSNFLNMLETYDKSDSAESFNGIYLPLGKNSELIFNISFEDGEDGSFQTNTDDYFEFLRKVESIDESYDEIRTAVLKALLRNGLIKSGPDLKKYDVLPNETEFVENIQNFEFNEEDDTLSTDIFLGKHKIESSNDIYTANISMMFGKVLENYLTMYYKIPVPSSIKQTTFDKFFESYQTITSSEKYGIESITCKYTSSFFDKELFNMKLQIKFEALNDKTSKVIKFIDDNYDDIINISGLIFFKLAGIQNEYTKKLNQVYGKLL